MMMVIVTVIVILTVTTDLRTPAMVVLIVHNDISFTLELYSNLSIDELKEGMLVELVVKIVTLIGTFFEPRPRHFKLSLEIVTWMHHMVRDLVVGCLHLVGCLLGRLLVVEHVGKRIVEVV